MCINKRYFYNNSKLLYMSQFPRLIQQGNCGKCCECMQMKSNELDFRSYYESLDTFNKNGFVIFDTLTYSEEYVPHINDVLNTNYEDNFYCFRNKDIVDFLKRFRISLKRHHHKYDKIKIMWTGEYGTDEHFTHRPHYHLIIFYTNMLKDTVYNIDPKIISYEISNNWKYGRTDGIKYKGTKYFYNKRLFTENNQYDRNITRYVCKYIEKESKYQKTIDERINAILKFKGLDGNLNYYDKLEAKKIKNTIRQTNRLSKNYGIYGINLIDENEIKLFNTISIPDRKYIRKSCNLPLYYRRKLYMNLMYYNIGNEIHSKWIYNEKGRDYERNLQYIKYTNLENKYRNALLNTDNPDLIKNLFDNRTLNQFIDYIFFYKNRLYSQYKYIKENYLNSLSDYDGKLLYNYSTSKDLIDYGDRYLLDKPINKTKNFKNIKTYKLINSQTCKDFYNFDDIQCILDNELKLKAIKKAKDYERLKEQKKRGKLLGLT